MVRDPWTGRLHTHYRDYDPLHARWLTEDPAGYRDGLNLYAAYMGVNWIDLLGLGRGRDNLNEICEIEKGIYEGIFDYISENPFNPNGYLCFAVRMPWTAIKFTKEGITAGCVEARDAIGKSNAPKPIKTTLTAYTYAGEASAHACRIFSETAVLVPVFNGATAIPYAGPVIEKGAEVLLLLVWPIKPTLLALK